MLANRITRVLHDISIDNTNVSDLSVKDLQYVKILVDVAIVLEKTRLFDHYLCVDVVDQQMSNQVLSFSLVCFHQFLQHFLNVHVEKRVGNFLANKQLGRIAPCFVCALLKIEQIGIELRQFLLQRHGCLGLGGGDSHDRSHVVCAKGVGEGRLGAIVLMVNDALQFFLI